MKKIIRDGEEFYERHNPVTGARELVYPLEGGENLSVATELVEDPLTEEDPFVEKKKKKKRRSGRRDDFLRVPRKEVTTEIDESVFDTLIRAGQDLKDRGQTSLGGKNVREYESQRSGTKVYTTSDLQRALDGKPPKSKSALVRKDEHRLPSIDPKVISALRLLAQEEDCEGIGHVTETTLKQVALRIYSKDYLERNHGAYEDIKKDILSLGVGMFEKYTSESGDDRMKWVHVYDLDYPLGDGQSVKNKPWKIKWLVKPNALDNEAYYIHLAEAISDETTRGKNRIYFSFETYVFRYAGEWKTGRKYPLSIKRMYEFLGVGKSTIDKPKRAFEFFQKGLQRVAKREYRGEKLLLGVEFINPDTKKRLPFKPQEIISSGEETQAELLSVLGTKDVTKLHVDFDLPAYGYKVEEVHAQRRLKGKTEQSEGTSTLDW